MILNRTDNPINREGRNKLNENWETLERTYKKVVDDSNGALNTANQANTKSDNAIEIVTQKGNEAIEIANQANNTSDYVQHQLDTVILENGNSDAEVVQARANFANLRERLDLEKAQFEMKIALMGSKKNGEIVLPSDFKHNLNFKLWRGEDGKIKHTFDADKYMSDWNVYYVKQTGNDNNDGLTTNTPKRSIAALITAIEADANVQNAKIIILGGYLSRTYANIQRTITKKYAIVGATDTETIIGNYEPNISWTQYGTNAVYSTPSTSANVVVYDRKFKDIFGLPLKYAKVASIAECEMQPSSYYHDGTVVYVHRQDDSAIDNNELHMCINAGLIDITFAADSTLILKDITYLNARTSDPFFIKSDATVTQGNVILDNVKLYSSYNSANGFRFYNVKSSWLFNCLAVDIAQDAYNYHVANTGVTPFAFEYNCTSYNSGADSIDNTCNATTAHDGYHILRINSQATKSKGPLLADVNGCYSICIDCIMHDSTITGLTKAAFHFNDTPWVGNATPNGKAILIGCEGGDSETYSISCGDTFKTLGKITIEQGFLGNNIPNDINLLIK